MWNRSCRRPGDQTFVVRGHETIVARTADPRQVRVIMLHRGWIQYTERCRDVGRALDMAGDYWDSQEHEERWAA